MHQGGSTWARSWREPVSQPVNQHVDIGMAFQVCTMVCRSIVTSGRKPSRLVLDLLSMCFLSADMYGTDGFDRFLVMVVPPSCVLCRSGGRFAAEFWPGFCCGAGPNGPSICGS